MACGCGKNNISDNAKSKLSWSIDRAKQIAVLRKQDVQVYKKGDLYEIEFPLRQRDNIIEVIKYNIIQ